MKKLFIMAAAALVLVGCGKKEATTATTEAGERTEVVELTTLHTREIQRDITLSSNLMGYETVNVAPSLTGKIEHIYVEVGDRVQKGSDLVRMDQQQYKTTKLTITNLETEMARMEGLIQTGSVSQQQYDQAKLSLDQTKENIAFLETNTYVKAPFAGVISAKNYEDGELYSGQPIVVLTQVDKLKTLIAIPESYIPQVKQGMRLTLHSEVYPDKTFPATIEVVYPTVDASSHTFQAKVVIPNREGLLRPGMYVTTTLGLGKADVITVPYSTVLKLVGANDRYVFINDNGRAKRVSVEMGQRFGDYVEISAPEIKDGVELVTKGEARLVDGVKISVADEQ
ncbi:MAG: efflux RND transporter periplasmic adaptor subunit [Paludibacteraceae bacterium]|nr:efflux RND transporter periplasmic adaptor subunit [Paludibacteraceae bacterium]